MPDVSRTLELFTLVVVLWLTIPVSRPAPPSLGWIWRISKPRSENAGDQALNAYDVLISSAVSHIHQDFERQDRDSEECATNATRVRGRQRSIA